MKKASSQKRSLLATLGVLLACGLLLSFSLHTAQPNHVHPGGHMQQSEAHSNTGTDFAAFSEYLHGTEKKLFIFTLLSFLLLGVSINAQTVLQLWVFLLFFFKKFLSQKLYVPSLRFFDIYVRLFSSGILNTKAY